MAPPNNPEAFESLCLELWKEIWKDPSAQKNGRSGQAQSGIDIFSQQTGLHAGIQCKQKDGLLRKKLSEKELRAEVKAAESFKPKLKKFILATTSARDATIQQVARHLSEKNQKNGLFSIEVWSWEDIWAEIYNRAEFRNRIKNVFWPALNSNKESSSAKMLTAAILAVFLILLFTILYKFPRSAEERTIAVSPLVFRQKADKVRLTIGNINLILEASPENSPKHPFSDFLGSRLKVTVETNRMWCDVWYANAFGMPPITLISNVLTGVPGDWDVNSTDKALEIVNEQGVPIFQMYLKSDFHVVFKGVVVNTNTLGLISETNMETIRNVPLTKFEVMEMAKKIGLKRIFKYPAWKFPGKYADE